MRIVSELARICFQAGRRQDAKKGIRRLLNWYHKQADLQPSFKSGAIVDLLPHHDNGEKPSNTKALYKVIMEGLDKYLGASHGWTQKVSQKYLCTYLPEERLNETEEICKRVLSTRSCLHGVGSKDVALMTTTKM